MYINTLVKQLKENNEDFEFYPTSPKMFEVIAPYLDKEVVLDIGCGNCGFYNFMNEYDKIQTNNWNKRQEQLKQEAEKQGKTYWRQNKDFNSISTYYIMEKSKTLLNQLPDKAICLGVDFEENTLIDKKVDTIFCNPPYSKFEEWTIKILSEGNYTQAFLVIPQRWKDNVQIMNIIKHYDLSYDILGSFDFLDAQRSARAKVDVVRFIKRKYRNEYSKGRNRENFDVDAFDDFFNKTFNLDKDKRKEQEKLEKKYNYESEKASEKVNAVALTIKQQSEQEGVSKAQILINLYQEEFEKLIKNLNTIMELDEDVLKTFGLSVLKVKEALKMKISGLKTFYWERVFDELDEITDRLTYKSRELLFDSSEQLKVMDFTIENIYAVLLYVIKHANRYYDSQLIHFFKTLSDKENVKPYKSNQKLFETDGWRWNSNNKDNYVLDYRIIMASPFRTTWSGDFDQNSYAANRTLKDIQTIANNLGFKTKGWENLPNNFGEKVYIYNEDGSIFMEYKSYKNNNMHVKFNKEFCKAMNVEVSRLLGWIRNKEDIAREFPAELAKGAEKYFKQNYNCLSSNGLLLLTAK